MDTYIHDPDAVLDYARDWSGWLASGETIATSLWIVPEGITEGASDHTDTTTVVWISGGTGGQQYRITNRITTSQGRTDDRSITLYVQDR